MKDHSFSVRILIQTVFKKWRSMLLFALVLMLLAGGWKAYKIWPRGGSNHSEAETESELESVAEMLQTDSDVSNDQSADEKNQMYFSAMIGRASEYINNTIFSRIDPNHVGVASADIAVTTQATESESEMTTAVQSDMDMQMKANVQGTSSSSASSDTEIVLTTPAQREAARILNAYTRYALYGVDWSAMAEQYDTKPEYIRELVSVNTDAEARTNSVTISVAYPDQEGAKALLDELLSQLKQYSSEIKDEYGEHTFTISGEMSSTVTDYTVAEKLNSRLTTLNGLINGSNAYKSAISTAESSVGSSAVGTAAASEPVNRKALLKSIFKFAMIGFVGGIVLYLLLGILGLLASGQVYSASEFNRQYGFAKIAVVPPADEKRRIGLDRFVRRDALEYRSSENRDVSWEIAEENLTELANGCSQVAIVGDVDRSYLEEMTKAFKEKHPDLKIVAVGDVLSSPAALHGLKEADAAVIGIRVGVSRYHQVDRILEILRDYNKEVIGSIILDD